MQNLNNLINKYGAPDALIDHWDLSSSRYAIWGFDSLFTINYEGYAFLNGIKLNINPLTAFQNVINQWKMDDNNISAIGYISYDFKNILFPHIQFKKLKKNSPLMWFGKPKLIKQFKIEISNNIDLASLQLSKDIIDLNSYKKNITKIKTHLMNGDTYQINFTQPKIYTTNTDGINLYLQMRNKIKPHYGMFINTRKMQILSFSPERFFNTHSEFINTYPMKGTRPRSSDINKDKILAKELYQSKKDRAEHLMIVDLLRNDLGKICKYGSIKVNNLYEVLSFETIHQMVSKVFGELKKSTKESDIIKAIFPGGSVTGAPKEKSMTIIDSLENYQRDIYTGAIGFIKKNGDMDFNIAIRTMTINKNLCTYPIGGGIVWDSNPIDEWNEAQYKSAILSPFTNDYHLNKQTTITDY